MGIKGRTQAILSPTSSSVSESSHTSRKNLPLLGSLKKLALVGMVVGLASVASQPTRAQTNGLDQKQQSSSQDSTDALFLSFDSFEASAKHWVSTVIDGNPAKVNNEQKLFASAIDLQISQVDIAENSNNGINKELASKFVQQLNGLKQILPQTNTVLTMKPFWERMSDALVTRSQIVLALQTGASPTLPLR